MTYSQTLRAAFTQKAHEVWVKSPQRRTCLDPHCKYCGYMNPKTDVPTGYTEFLEEIVDQMHEALRNDRTVDHHGVQPDVRADTDETILDDRSVRNVRYETSANNST